MTGHQKMYEGGNVIGERCREELPLVGVGRRLGQRGREARQPAGTSDGGGQRLQLVAR